MTKCKVSTFGRQFIAVRNTVVVEVPLLVALLVALCAVPMSNAVVLLGTVTLVANGFTLLVFVAATYSAATGETAPDDFKMWVWFMVLWFPLVCMLAYLVHHGFFKPLIPSKSTRRAMRNKMYED